MAIGPITFLIGSTPKPAYDLLMRTAWEIALTHGEDAATQWAQRNIDGAYDLFFTVSLTPARPPLKVIAGGRAD